MSSFRPQVAPAHYQSSAYATKERFINYWHQIDEVLRLQPASVLEVGIGSGFVQRYLRERGISIHTADADARLQPDTLAVLPKLSFADGEFDVVCCFEVLEHLPFDLFAECVRELKRVARRWVLVSLPDVTPYARLSIEWGFKRHLLRRFFDLKQVRPPQNRFNGEHYWEIGKQGFPLERVLRAIRDQGFLDLSSFRIEEDPWHRFLRCRVG
jgi:SAM-dependent methyltransferase